MVYIMIYSGYRSYMIIHTVKYVDIYWLVVDKTPLKYLKVKWDDDIPN